MEFKLRYVPEEASLEVNKPMEQIYSNQVLLKDCSAIPDYPFALQTLLKRGSVEMQFNQTNVPDQATSQVSKPMEQIHYNRVLHQNCSSIPDCPRALETLLQRESVEQFKRETKKTISYMYSKGHRSTNRREKNRERERKRQTLLKGAFNLLRSVIPDYFSERESGDRLSRIQTLRLAKKYIATLQELLETS